MNSALRAGIYTLGKTVTGLSASNLYYENAKHSQQSLYCVFFGVDEDFQFDSGAQHEVSNVQFTFYGTNLANLETQVTNFRTVFDFTTSLSVSGYTVIEVRRTITIPPRKFDGMWQIVLEYRFEIQKARS